MRVFHEAEIRSAITLEEVIPAIEQSFVAYSQQTATVPPVVHLDIPEERGEIHIKAAYMHGAQDYVIKIAAGFYNNRQRNLPVGSGMMLVFNAKTGFPEAILIDNAYLTDVRTAAAGGVAAKYMAVQNVRQVGVIGAGVQGRLQVQALACVRKFPKVMIYDHHTTNVAKYLEDMRGKVAAEIHIAETVQQAVQGSQVVITATPSRQPFVKSEWLEPGTHITALGSDGPDKQELETGVLARADRIVADSITQCVKFGEIHHAIAAGVLKEADLDGELGDVIMGKVKGRAKDQEITVCDLTGIGVQDAAIAALVYRRLSLK